MKVYCVNSFQPISLPEGHLYPKTKYSLLYQRLHDEKIEIPIELIQTDEVTEEQILKVHHKEYFHKLRQGALSEKEIRRIGFPWSKELIKRTFQSVGGTIAACRTALLESLSLNLGGGTHHAHPDHGQGFCILNDTAIAARVMQDDYNLKYIAILDCDVHQGNGTAAVFANDPSVFTFSLHAAKNFPFRKKSSDLDIALPDGISDQSYLEMLEQGINRVFNVVQPDLIIYIAGADPYKNDRLGRLALSKDGLARRDKYVIEQGLVRDIPTAIVLGGGYGKDIEDTVDIHYETVRTASCLLESRLNSLHSKS